MVWFKEIHVHRRDWILDHFHQLDLLPVEFLVVSLIDLANQKNEALSNDYLIEKSNLSANEIDRTINSLIQKKYLSIRATRKHIEFDISELFLSDFKRDIKNGILESFESEFGRPLSLVELESLNQIINRYDEKLIIYSLRQASVRNKLNMSYIERILQNESSKK